MIFCKMKVIEMITGSQTLILKVTLAPSHSY